MTPTAKIAPIPMINFLKTDFAFFLRICLTSAEICSKAKVSPPQFFCKACYFTKNKTILLLNDLILFR